MLIYRFVIYKFELRLPFFLQRCSSQGISLFLTSICANDHWGRRTATQGLGQYLGGLGVGGVAAEDHVLHAIDYDFRTLLAEVLFQLSQ